MMQCTRGQALTTISAPIAVGFRSKTTIDESPETLRRVSLAVARAKEGDREAIRFLYVQYSHNIYGYVRSIIHDENGFLSQCQAPIPVVSSRSNNP